MEIVRNGLSDGDICSTESGVASHVYNTPHWWYRSSLRAAAVASSLPATYVGMLGELWRGSGLALMADRVWTERCVVDTTGLVSWPCWPPGMPAAAASRSTCPFETLTTYVFQAVGTLNCTMTVEHDNWQMRSWRSRLKTTTDNKTSNVQCRCPYFTGYLQVSLVERAHVG